MNARNAQLGAVQGADKERKGGVQDGTASTPQNQQRSNVPRSTGRIDGSADEKADTMRNLVINQYEIGILYHPDLEIDLDKAESKVKKIFTTNGGKVTKVDNWGKRKLAYPIKKQEHAVYVFYTIDLPGESVRKVENTLNITDEVIRFLITRPDLRAIAKAETIKAEKAKKAAVRGGTNNEEKDENDE